MHAAAGSGEGSKLVWIQRAIPVLIREIKEVPAWSIEVKLWLFVRRRGGDAARLARSTALLPTPSELTHPGANSESGEVSNTKVGPLAASSDSYQAPFVSRSAPCVRIERH